MRVLSSPVILASSPSPARLWVSALCWLTQALAVRAQRRALLRLEAARLRDIGVSRAAAWDEGNRPFWDMH